MNKVVGDDNPTSRRPMGRGGRRRLFSYRPASLAEKLIALILLGGGGFVLFVLNSPRIVHRLGLASLMPSAAAVAHLATVGVTIFRGSLVLQSVRDLVLNRSVSRSSAIWVAVFGICIGGYVYSVLMLAG